MSLNFESRAKFNLRSANIMLIESSPMGMEILMQIMIGFGAKTLIKCESVEKAKEQLVRNQFDLMILDAVPADAEGYEFVRWLRAQGTGDNRYAPVIVVSSHTSVGKVAKVRDSGAHFIVAKPLTPQVLMERILWIAKESRPFVSSSVYCGPDRRFKFTGPPVNTTGRRDTDLSADLGQAKEPNMSQDQIDALLQPRKAAL